MREEKTTSIERQLKCLRIPPAPRLPDVNRFVAPSVLNNRVKVQKVAKVCQFRIIGAHNATALEGMTIAHEPTGAVAVAAALPPSNSSAFVECAS